MELLRLIAWIFLFVWIAMTSYNVIQFYGSLKDKKIKRKNPPEFPRVTVVLPAKNEEKTIRWAIESLLNQNYPKDRFKVLLVEDGSEDRTPEICKEYAEKYDFIELIQPPESKGKPYSLNYATKFIDSDYIIYMDADTFLPKNFVREIVFYALGEDADAVQATRIPVALNTLSGNLYMIFENYYSYLIQKFRANITDSVLLEGNGMLLKADFVKKNGWNEKSVAEDLDISILGHLEGRRFLYVPLTYYVEFPSTPKSIYHQRKRWHRGTIQAAFKYWRKIIENRKKMGFKKTFELLFSLFSPVFQFVFFFGTLFAIFLSVTNLWVSIFPPWALIAATSCLILTLEIYAFVARFGLRKRKLLFLVPLVPLWWVFDQIIAICAFLEESFGRPAYWIKTPKTGQIKALLG